MKPSLVVFIVPLVLGIALYYLTESGAERGVDGKTMIKKAMVSMGLDNKNSAEQKEEEKRVTATTIELAEQKKWKACWRKPPSLKGNRPDLREACYPAKIVQYSSVRFVFQMSYKHKGYMETATFSWDKGKGAHGQWFQKAPYDRGSWNLKKVSPDLFSGWGTNKNGEEFRFWLQSIP